MNIELRNICYVILAGWTVHAVLQAFILPAVLFDIFFAAVFQIKSFH